MTLTASTRFAPGAHLLADTHEDGAGAAVTIRGDDLVVDFAGAVLRGTPESALPDARQGTGIRVIGRNITIRGARVHGYKIGLIARDAPGLKIIDSDFSDCWKQHLRSTREREDLSDWMSFHHNEQDEWLRYGAGIYLSGCDNAEIRGCTITGGQCGLMLTRCAHALVWNNDFSFLSGIGIGMYRSSSNRIMHNRVDWCVRGYSHGVYNRGQDSAGILVYEQSSHNIFAYNSVTHGGDGFFLWAGQTTMDTGAGGCNDNLVCGNDFSHAPTNGMELTFSRNRLINNRLMECWHGLWGGYSFDTLVGNNVFALNACSIAIEHGQHNAIQGNRFIRELAGIQLWQNKSQDPNWGYPKHHDTQSHDYRITGNTFDSVDTAVSLRDTAEVTLRDNRYERTAQPLTTEGDTSGLQNADGAPTTGTPLPPLINPNGNALTESADLSAADYARLFRDIPWDPYAHAPVAPLPGGQSAFLHPDQTRGRRYIIVDEWGPYDFRSPRLVPRGPAPGQPGALRFEVLGPKGRWRIKKSDNLTFGVRAGTVPAVIDATVSAPDSPLMGVDLEYVGATATRDFRGIVTPAGRPIAFGWHRTEQPIGWDVRWYRWTPDADPRTSEAAFAALLRGSDPLKTVHTPTLDFAGNGAFTPGLPPDHYATVAEGRFTIPTAGQYTLEVTTDDGCRAWLDDKPVITNAWKYQGPTLYTADISLAPGAHTLRVEHFQIDGYAALQVHLKRR